MIQFDTSLLQDKLLQQILFQGKFGLEKEHVRVTQEGKLTLTPHPKALGDKATHPYITTDFSESQVEIITPPLDGVDKAYHMLQTLHNIVALNIGNEYLWPQSIPPILPEESEIPIAQFGTTPESRNKEQYREQLAQKYGKKRQMISGIHVNFSFDKRLLQLLYQRQYQGKGKAKQSEPSVKDFTNFTNQLYLKVMRHTTKYSWFLIKLLGSSPVFHESYSKCCKQHESRISFRNGRCGYANQTDLYVPMNNLSTYMQGVEKLIAENHITSAKELYSLIRPKNSLGDHDYLPQTGIEYLELRMVDINPLFSVGISKQDLYLMHSFLLLMALMDDEDMTKEVFTEAMANNRAVADCGRQENSTVMVDGVSYKTRGLGARILAQLADIASVHKGGQYAQAVAEFTDYLNNPEKLYSHRIYQELKGSSYVDYHMKKARLYRTQSKSQQFNVIGYEDMELSTQILMLDALRRGLGVEILDRHENFIRLSSNQAVQGDERTGQFHTEYVKQATKTSKDSYSTVLMMEHKGITKQVLQEAGIPVPKGAAYTNIAEAKAAYLQHQTNPVVIKPNSTNFGIGITIFTNPCTQTEYHKALDLAFQHDSTVLVEKFIAGKEYRLFVIGEQVVAALHRVPANVLGDGVHTIAELVAAKNRDPLRGERYQKPLQKIALTQEKLLFLASKGLRIDTVPAKDEVVYLTESSNISTGGDSIDVTDTVSEGYKQIAVAAAKAMGATITGVDLMTTDITAEPTEFCGAHTQYAIIELNFNPAIHIHCYPYKGKNRHLGDKILDVLGF